LGCWFVPADCNVLILKGREMVRGFGIILSYFLAVSAMSADTYTAHGFKKLQLSDQFFCEGATFGDFNGDGVMDVVSGPYWYAGPDFAKRHEYYAPKAFDIAHYSDNFFAFSHDVNRDGWTDIVIIGFPGKEAYWFANPQGKPGPWERHLILSEVDNESPTFLDLTGDGKPEIVCASGGQYGFAEIPSDAPATPWKFHPISPQRGYKRFTHGLGVGDLNGDGRKDLLEKDGWWEQPAAGAKQEFWNFHAMKFSNLGGAQMLAFDVDGDGDNDIVTSTAAHAYGLSWFENTGTRDGEIAFVQHSIMGSKPEQNEFGLAISELHALALADMDHDGIPDIITGKRWWAHANKDPGALEPPLLYWFRTSREGKQIRFIPYRIDGDSGVGTQVVAGDINGDKWDDVIVGNKKGTFVFTHVAQQVDRRTWETAQPKRINLVPQQAASSSQKKKKKPSKPAVDAKTTKTTKNTPQLRDDNYPYAGLSGEQAARVMKLPTGFNVMLAAAEPDVKQPIAIALDDRGRLWVAEAYSYPVRAPEGEGHDRILIFEDTDGDGKFDKRKVFIDKLNLVSGMEIGFGGVFVGAAPQLLFIPDKNGDDIPDGKPEVLLDGWAYQDTHETLNTFTWGPDGWLYGCHGVFTYSLVGAPNTAASKRTPINAGIWRYHPTLRKFEVFAEGTSNPWGLDFDDHGQAFCTACVIPHLYHVIQGGRYVRQAGPHADPYTYEDIQTIADHRHYLGTPHGGNGKSNDAGGGHAHAGAMIYLGGAWPDEYRHTIFMNNIHGQRVNNDLLERKGSGFVGHHGKDFLLTGDLASQMLNFRYGPDGQVYINDWYDLNACHERKPEAHDRTTGRIYKVTYGTPQPQHVELKKLNDQQLVELVLEKNDWYVRHSRRILQERAADGSIDASARKRLIEIATTHRDETRRLRAMWSLHVTGGLPSEIIDRLLADENEYVRGWTIQLALDTDKPRFSELLPKLASMASRDGAPVVRLYLAAAMQRVPAEKRWAVVRELTKQAEDAGDPNLPLMYWYAIEPLVIDNPQRAFELAMSCGKSIPQVREFVLRRIASLDADVGIIVLVAGLSDTNDDEAQLSILAGLRNAVHGRRHVEKPKLWPAVYAKLQNNPNEELRTAATTLSAVFGDRSAVESLEKVTTNSSVPTARRREALRTLLDIKAPGLAPMLQDLLSQSDLREDALAGLASYNDKDTTSSILAIYSQLSPSEKRLALSTLASRATSAGELLMAVEHQKVPIEDLSADLVRQIHNLNNPSIDRMLDKSWGQIRATPAEKMALTEKYRRLLKKPPEPSDPMLGRAVFARTCQQCHVLFGIGGKVGPDLTGSNRFDVEYLLANIVDPSAVIAKEYRPTIITTNDGRTVTGIVSAEDAASVTLRTADNSVQIPTAEIDLRSLSEKSMMPDDQLKQFSSHEVTSLVAYLRSKLQVPMLANKQNEASFYNGKDLAGWTGNANTWSVENGEIVGRTNGPSHDDVLVSEMAGANFKLSFDVKVDGESAITAVQFRMQTIKGSNKMRGYEATFGPGRWGMIDEVLGQTSSREQGAVPAIKSDDWNHFELHATGGNLQAWLNGQLCAEINHTKENPPGVFCLSLRGDGPSEARFRNIRLQVEAENDKVSASVR
jgi:putative membrane-bound dehydrogenase-like protein